MRRHRPTAIALYRLDTVDTGHPEDVGFCAACANLPPTSLAFNPSFSDLLGEEVTEDDFQREVAAKTQSLLIGRLEAEREVVIDRLINKYGDKEKALMFVVTKFPSEYKVQIFTNMLLQRGANPSTCDERWHTPLHHAVKRNFKAVCSKLLENAAIPHVRDKDNNMPYHIALRNSNDDIASLLLSYMPNVVVRNMFVTRTSSRSECSLHKLLEKNMQQTALGVLDCMVDPIGDTGHVQVYYHVLEADDHGRPPSHRDFDADSKCCLHLIAKEGLKAVVFHDVVRLLIRRKWKNYARFRFLVNSIGFCFTLFCLTFSLAVATLTPDPTSYSDPLQITRGVTEAWSSVAVATSLFLEINQMRKHRSDYWKEKFNWLDVSSSCLLLTVIPLRFTHTQEQWHVFSVGYLLWTLKIFKYAAVFRQTGAYTLILLRILGHDFVQFTILFSVILIAFSGSLVLALRGENSLDVHFDTGTFWHTMFTGFRILIESDPVVEYYGQGGYKPLSCILMVIFLITCCVVLLNILIAQLSDTYQNIQEDAQRGLELNRAWIITRVELNSILIRKSYRIRKYCESEAIQTPQALLEKWESPPLSDMTKHIRSISDGVDSNKLNLMTVENRLVRQEQSLTRMQNVLDELVSCLRVSRSKINNTASQTDDVTVQVSQHGQDNGRQDTKRERELRDTPTCEGGADANKSTVSSTEPVRKSKICKTDVSDTDNSVAPDKNESNRVPDLSQSQNGDRQETGAEPEDSETDIVKSVKDGNSTGTLQTSAEGLSDLILSQTDETTKETEGEGNGDFR